MQVEVGIEGFQGVIQDVHIFLNPDDTAIWAKKYMKDDPDLLKYVMGEAEDYPEESNLEPTNIYQVEVPDTALIIALAERKQKEKKT